MGNLLFGDENPQWNNLPPEHTAKEAKGLDELFTKLRSYGGKNGEVDEEDDEDFSPTPLSKCDPSPLASQSHIILMQSTKIYPEQSRSTSQKTPSPGAMAGRGLVSLR
jgi:hypothetical protein